MTLRIGSGAAFSNDRVEPAVDLVRRGQLDYIVFECLAERTLAISQAQRMRDPDKGYNTGLERRLRNILPLCVENGTRIVSNMGSANPRAAGEAACNVARELGLKGVKIGVVEGDDVIDLMSDDTPLPELGTTIGGLGMPMISANAYIGVDGLRPALEAGADVVLAGRASDSSLFVAPIAHHFGWRNDDWDRLARGAVAGHLMECTGQVTGGCFADPGYKEVPDIAYVGYPFAEVGDDGSFVLTKLDGTGGLVSIQTVKEQLLYEVHDPRAYKTPDVTANFATVQLASLGKDRIEVRNATGKPRPDQLKVTVGFDAGFFVEAEISYAGPGAMNRGELARSILIERFKNLFQYPEPVRVDLIGVDSVHLTAVKREARTEDVRVRIAMRTRVRERAERVAEEIECMGITGPAGGGGFRATIIPSVATHSTYVDRNKVNYRLSLLQS